MLYCNIVVDYCQPLSGTAYRNRTHIQEVEALCIIHYTKAVFPSMGDLKYTILLPKRYILNDIQVQVAVQ